MGMYGPGLTTVHLPQPHPTVIAQFSGQLRRGWESSGKQRKDRQHSHGYRAMAHLTRCTV
jgi:hypothetical protein